MNKSQTDTSIKDNGHRWVQLGGPEDGDVRCMHCDCRPSGRWARQLCDSVKL